jgi:hypothetical protein
LSRCIKSAQREACGEPNWAAGLQLRHGVPNERTGCRLLLRTS